MYYFGLLTGILALLVIGMGFPLVIQAERRLGYLWWPYMMGLGVLVIIGSFFISNDWLSVFIGVLGATFSWGSTELKDQAARAELGWFPFWAAARKIQPPLADVIKKWPAPHL